MAKFVLTDADVVIDGNNLSDHVESLTINHGVETPESTSMGDTTRRRLVGLLDWSIDITFRQDFTDASNTVDEILFPLVGAAAFVIVIKPTSAAVGVNNPTFTGTCLLQTYNPLAGTVADTAAANATFVSDGTLVRATA